MGTINHMRAAQNNTFIAMECEREHAKPKENDFPGYLRKSKPAKVDAHTRRSNICSTCHMAKALNGSHVCDE